MKPQEDYPATENHGKERLEDYSTSVTRQINLANNWSSAINLHDQYTVGQVLIVRFF